MPTANVIDKDGLRTVLKAACAAGGGVTAWAKGHGVSRAFVYEVMSGDKPAPQSFLDALGYERVPSEPLFRKKGKINGQGKKERKIQKAGARAG